MKEKTASQGFIACSRRAVLAIEKTNAITLKGMTVRIFVRNLRQRFGFGAQELLQLELPNQKSSHRQTILRNRPYSLILQQQSILRHRHKN